MFVSIIKAFLDSRSCRERNHELQERIRSTEIKIEVAEKEHSKQISELHAIISKLSDTPSNERGSE